MPLLLPSRDSDMRSAFDQICEQHGLRCRVLAEVDNRVLLRLLALDSGAVAPLPSVVARDELSSGEIVECCAVRDLSEHLYAIMDKRHFSSCRC